MDLPQFEEDREAFKKKLEAFLSRHMPVDWMVAMCVVIPEPKADTTIGHVWSYSNISDKEERTMIVGHWYLNLREQLA